ncbi:MFS transporter [Bradyrhizobium sp. 25ACV]
MEDAVHTTSNSMAGIKPILVCLAIGIFAIGTEGLMIAGVLPGIASELKVTEAVAGYLVTAFSLVYAIGSPVLAVALAGVRQRRLIGLAMLLFALGNVLAAVAPTYGTLMLARVVLAASAGVFMPAALNAAGRLVAPEMRGRALALVNCGGAIALMVGVPLGALIGEMAGWRFSFVLVAVLSGAASLVLLSRLPELTFEPAGTLGERIGAARRPEISASLLTTLFWAMGINALYTFIAVYLKQVAEIVGAQLGLVLFGIGLASSIGAYLGGAATDRWGARRVRAAAIAAMAFLYITMALLGTMGLQGPVCAVALPALMMICAGIAWMFYAAQQVRLLQLVPPASGALVLSLNASSMYLGFAGGAVAGAAMLLSGDVISLAWISALCELVGLCVLVVIAFPGSLSADVIESTEGKA